MSEDNTEVPCAIMKEDIIYPTYELISLEKQVRV